MKKFYLLLIFALVASVASARQISPSEAKTIAASKVPALRSAAAQMQSRAQAPDALNAPVYLFNAPNGGFAIVAGDDRMPNMVLAYSETGTLDLENCAPAMKAWLEEMEACISNGNFSAVSTSNLDYSNPVAPMVTTKWNQGAPYNLLTPLGSTGEHCPTGCAATAMAQIVNYWEYPKAGGLMEKSYEWNGQTLSVDFRNSIYDWDNMADVYDQNSTEAQNNAVAKLMWDCGVASSMNYGDKESGATDLDVALGLIDCFGYNPGLSVVQRDYTPKDEWFEIVKTELDQKRPLLYCGSTINEEGHAFVCDGYDESGLFHINWGWGGMSDGYFDISALDPTQHGIGGAQSGEGFSCNQTIIKDLRPAQEGDVAGLGWNLTIQDFEFKVDEKNSSVFSINWVVANLGIRAFEGDLIMYLIPESQPKEIIREELCELAGEDALLPGLGLTLGLDDLDASQFSDDVYTLKFGAIGKGMTEADEVEIMAEITAPPMSFEVKDGKVVYVGCPTLVISDVEIDEYGFYYTIGGGVRGMVANLTFNVENTSNIWFNSALAINLLYTNGVFSDYNKETYHLRDIPKIGPGEKFEITTPIQYNVKGLVKIEISTTNRSTEEPQEANFVDNAFEFENDAVYHELEFAEMPTATEADGKITIAAQVKSCTGEVKISGGPAVDLESITEKEVVCTIYKEGSDQSVATATATYAGKWDEAKTLTYTFDGVLEKGDYTAVFSYQTVPDLLGKVLDINIGDEEGEFPGLKFTVSSTTGITNIAEGSDGAAAEIYTTTGIRMTGAENLAPGVYIKRQGSKVSKFIIK